MKSCWPLPISTIMAFDRLANGNVAPKRVLGGPDTQLTAALTHQNDDGSRQRQPCIRIDPIHNLLLVPTVAARGGLCPRRRF